MHMAKKKKPGKGHTTTRKSRTKGKGGTLVDNPGGLGGKGGPKMKAPAMRKPPPKPATPQ
jgi:hypothetical protein